MEVAIHNSDAIEPKIIPRVSTFRASEMPGDMAKSSIAGFFPFRTSGNNDNTTPKVVIDAIIVQLSRIFGQRDESNIRITAITGISTAINGHTEKIISIIYSDLPFYEMD